MSHEAVLAIELRRLAPQAKLCLAFLTEQPASLRFHAAGAGPVQDLVGFLVDPFHGVHAGARVPGQLVCALALLLELLSSAHHQAVVLADDLLELVVSGLDFVHFCSDELLLLLDFFLELPHFLQ